MVSQMRWAGKISSMLLFECTECKIKRSSLWNFFKVWQVKHFLLPSLHFLFQFFSLFLEGLSFFGDFSPLFQNVQFKIIILLEQQLLLFPNFLLKPVTHSFFPVTDLPILFEKFCLQYQKGVFVMILSLPNKSFMKHLQFCHWVQTCFPSGSDTAINFSVL